MKRALEEEIEERIDKEVPLINKWMAKTKWGQILTLHQGIYLLYRTYKTKRMINKWNSYNNFGN